MVHIVVHSYLVVLLEIGVLIFATTSNIPGVCYPYILVSHGVYYRNISDIGMHIEMGQSLVSLQSRVM